MLRDVVAWRSDRASLRLVATVLLAALLAGITVAVTGAGTVVEHELHDVRDGLRRHNASGHNVLIEIDARSLSQLNHWPWPRGLFAQAVGMLGRARAGTIAFDVDFSAQSVPDQDRALARAFSRAQAAIVLPTFRQYASLHSNEIFENLPIFSFRPYAQLASVNIMADGDGLVRSYPFGTTTGGVPRPSIGAMLAGATGRSDTTFPIDGAIDPDSIPRISFVDLVHGRVPPGALAGKSVLIGSTAIELVDRYPVPRYGVIPGPVIQILAAETLQDGSSPVDHGTVPALLGATLILLLAVRIERRRRRAAVIGLGGALLVGLPLLLESAHLGTVDVVPGMAELAVGAATLALATFLSTLRSARLLDPVSELPNRRGFIYENRSELLASVTAVRIANYSDAAALLGQARAAELIRRVTDRLRVAGIARLYRLEEGVLAWTSTAGDGEVLTDGIDALAALLRAPVEVGGRQVELRCHFGTASGSDVDPDTLADRAILAAERAVARGARWEQHSAQLGEEQDWRLTLSGELDQALARGDVWVAYQPKLNIASGRVLGAEALVRWRHPDRGPIPPDAFIPALEASGRILDLTLFVLNQAARDAAQWRALGSPMNVAVNVSALLAADDRFLSEVDALLESRTIAPELLTLEVTESATLADPEQAIAALERIAARGIKISIDDYGTGQSTLTYLKRLPAREIKIDKSFVLGLETSRSDQAMVRSTVQLAHELGFAVVAEGVETAGVLAVLADMGCDTAQGWHVGKPIPATDFTAAFVPSLAAAA